MEEIYWKMEMGGKRSMTVNRKPITRNLSALMTVQCARVSASVSSLSLSGISQLKCGFDEFINFSDLMKRFRIILDNNYSNKSTIRLTKFE